jgi:hypothetical protein
MKEISKDLEMSVTNYCLTTRNVPKDVTPVQYFCEKLILVYRIKEDPYYVILPRSFCCSVLLQIIILRIRAFGIPKMRSEFGRNLQANLHRLNTLVTE